MLIWLNSYNAVGVNIATQTEKKKIKSVAKDTVNGLIRAATELKVVKIIITTKRKRGLKMPEYIERESLVEDIKQYSHGRINGDAIEKMGLQFVNEMSSIQRIVEKQPAADVVEVKHGEWKPKHYEGGFMDGTNFEECSICRYRRYFDDIRFKLTFDYCPKCGAKMDGKEGAD